MSSGQGNGRIAYIYGPVDAREVHAAWQNDTDLAYLGSSYVTQFLAETAKRGAKTLIITNHAGDAYDETHGDVEICNIPWPESGGGARFHIAWIRWTLTALRRARRFDPDVTVLSAAQNYWFLASRLLPRTTFVVALHGAIWPRVGMRPAQRFVTGLNRSFYRRAQHFLLASHLIARQIEEFCGTPRASHVFLPTYTEERFATATPVADVEQYPLCVFFAGRIEANKGIYDLVEVARRIDATDPGAVRFHVCGEGSELERLRRTVVDRQLEHVVDVHGFCAAPEMLTILDRCHITIVPTRTDFEEGFNMVCAESVLAGRPVVTSDVCPAIEYLPHSTIEVEPDDTSGYESAIRTVLDDRRRLADLADGCTSDRGQFLDPANSYGSLLGDILDQIDASA